MATLASGQTGVAWSAGAMASGQKHFPSHFSSWRRVLLAVEFLGVQD